MIKRYTNLRMLYFTLLYLNISRQQLSRGSALDTAGGSAPDLVMGSRSTRIWLTVRRRRIASICREVSKVYLTITTSSKFTRLPTCHRTLKQPPRCKVQHTIERDAPK